MGVRQPQHIGDNIIGHFPSLKNKGSVPFKSTIERDCIYLLKYDPSITHYEAQPCVIQYELNGRIRRYAHLEPEVAFWLEPV